MLFKYSFVGGQFCEVLVDQPLLVSRKGGQASNSTQNMLYLSRLYQNKYEHKAEYLLSLGAGVPKTRRAIATGPPSSFPSVGQCTSPPLHFLKWLQL